VGLRGRAVQKNKKGSLKLCVTRCLLLSIRVTPQKPPPMWSREKKLTLRINLSKEVSFITDVN